MSFEAHNRLINLKLCCFQSLTLVSSARAITKIVPNISGRRRMRLSFITDFAGRTLPATGRRLRLRSREGQLCGDEAAAGVSRCERERGTKVHKCQGMTLDRVIVDLKHFTFGKTPYASCPEPAIDWRWQVALEPVVGCGGCRRGCAKPTFCVRLPLPSSGSVVSLQSSRTQRSCRSCDYSRRWLYVGGQAGG